MALLTRFGLPQARIEALAERLRRGGARGVAIARATPGVRVPAIAASGVAALPMRSFAPGLVAGNTLFVGLHFLLGFIVGVPAVAFVERYGLLVVVVGVGLLAVVGAIGWLILRRRQSFNAWADAACPACLTLAVVRGND
jgi:membrane protein DedA with SNARE-associated domain